MAKQLSWHSVERTVRQRGLTLFSPQDLRHLLNASQVSISLLLTRAHKLGDVLKLRRGLYALPDRIPSKLVIAEPEKAFPDTLYLANLRRLTLPERMDMSGLDWKRVLELARLYKRRELTDALQEFR